MNHAHKNKLNFIEVKGLGVRPTGSEGCENLNRQSLRKYKFKTRR